MDRLELQEKNIFTVSQIFKTGINGMLTQEFNADLNEILITSPRLLHKLKLLQKQTNKPTQMNTIREYTQILK